MWTLILFALCIIALAIVVFRMSKKPPLPHDTYVCEQCGEKNCICHKQKEG
jgi:hypothetical protein